tara:strand:+ start:121 stop:489 length:369 start_codon:yes stop_codon:yes gene_type:complete
MSTDVEKYLQIWAQAARQMPKVGWYSEQPWYTPTGYRESAAVVTTEDQEIADRVGAVVARLFEKEQRSAELITIFYWAMPGELVEKPRRLQIIEAALNIPRREAYRQIDALKRLIEGAVFFN